jgi:hypothetical protein
MRARVHSIFKRILFFLSFICCFVFFTNCSSSFDAMDLDQNANNIDDGNTLPPTPTPIPLPAEAQNIGLFPNGTVNASELVNVGIPFRPGQFLNENLLRIVNENGQEVAAHVKVVLRWHGVDNSIRAVKVQFMANVSQGSKVYSFVLGQARTMNLTEQNYASGLKPGKEGFPEPRVFATLSPEWMTESLIAGPQNVADENPQELFFEHQFDTWAGTSISFSAPHIWLYDRVTAIAKMYVKTGELKYLKEFVPSWRYYVSHFQLTGASPASCNGGWNNGQTNVCDMKYTYIHPILLAMGLLGDDTQLTTANVNLIADYVATAGWHNNPLTPYTNPAIGFTERNFGVQLRGLIAAYEITGNTTHLNQIRQQIDNSYEHFYNNPDGFGAAGCLRHSWSTHEGDTFPGNIAADRGCSPWMMAMSVGAKYKAFQLLRNMNGESGRALKALSMILDSGQYMATYGRSRFMFPSVNSWKHPCNTGDLTLYWSSSVATPATIQAIQEDSGWYSDSHNPEVWNTLNYIALLETNTTRRNIIIEGLNQMQGYLNPTCANISSTPRAFTWQHYNVEKGFR